jgi:hypothetical protein
LFAGHFGTPGQRFAPKIPALFRDWLVCRAFRHSKAAICAKNTCTFQGLACLPGIPALQGSNLRQKYLHFSGIGLFAGHSGTLGQRLAVWRKSPTSQSG